MIIELGHFALILAFLVSVAQMTIPMIGAAKGWADWMRVAVPAALLQFLLTFAAFLALAHAFTVSDFSVSLVALNSHSTKPLLYKITGTWGNHEGSMLLCACSHLSLSLAPWWPGKAKTWRQPSAHGSWRSSLPSRRRFLPSSCSHRIRLKGWRCRRSTETT